VAHGLQKKVIPITNTQDSEKSPFDVKGLWHIFFSDEDDLRKQLSKVVPQISIETFRETEDEPYRKIWNPILAGKNTLHIIYYGRPYEGVKRGNRTNIDSWDTKTVSEASFYLAQKYPTTIIKAAPPKTKLENPVPEKDNIIKSLTNDYANCLLVGSPDANDYSEVVLAKIFGTEPFVPRKKYERKGFLFYKDYLDVNLPCAFYRKCNSGKEGVKFGRTFYSIERTASGGETFGVLVIARNPFEPKSAVIILSGFTGIATYGLMGILINTETSMGILGQDFKKFKSALEFSILKNFDPTLQKPFVALIKFTYSINANLPGDNRNLEEVAVMAYGNELCSASEKI